MSGAQEKRKRLTAASSALAYQREWFAGLHEHVAGGGKFALVNADTPHEILRAFDIPYVVNQWWSSIAASRGGAQRYLSLVEEQGLPRNSEQYNAIGIGSALDNDPETAPWGGLPRPFLVLGDITGDITRKVFDVWGMQDGITFFPLENSAEAHSEGKWWDRIATDWEELTGSARIDLLVDELGELIKFLEEATGQKFDPDKLARIMELGNEQAAWNKRTRDLIAATYPCPLSLNDSISAVMVPQWHRGTEWGRDAARSLYEEVEQLIADGASMADPERVRLMWIGRGLWFDLGFYRYFEESYGAVFVWSMYLAIAADGYARHGDDPLRALAARFVGFHEHLYVAPMSAEWYVQQAQMHGVDGVVHLVADDPRGNWATTRALQAAGIPVIEVQANNADESGYDIDAFRGGVARWIEAELLGEGESAE